MNMPWTDVTVVMPAYNEEDCIAPLIQRILELYPGIKIVVVDDGSADRTVEKSLDAGAYVLKHNQNWGNGWAVRNGILVADTTFVVLMDSDGQHPPEAIDRLVASLENCSMAIGCRTKGSAVSRLRSFGNMGLQFVAKRITGEHIEDLTSGFRAFRRKDMLTVLSLFPRKYSYPTTSAIAFLKDGKRICWVRIPEITRRKGGKSGINPLQDGLRFIYIIMRITATFGGNRIFIGLSGMLFLAGLIVGILQIFFTSGLRGLSIVMFSMAMNVFFFGLISELISNVHRSVNGLYELEDDFRAQLISPVSQEAGGQDHTDPMNDNTDCSDASGGE